VGTTRTQTNVAGSLLGRCWAVAGPSLKAGGRDEDLDDSPTTPLCPQLFVVSAPEKTRSPIHRASQSHGEQIPSVVEDERRSRVDSAGRD